MNFSENPTYCEGKWIIFAVRFLTEEDLIHILRVDASDMATTLLPQSSDQHRLPSDNMIFGPLKAVYFLFGFILAQLMYISLPKIKLQ